MVSHSSQGPPLGGGILAVSQPLGQERGKAGAVAAQQALDVQNAGPLLAFVPRRMQPPAAPFLLVQLSLQQPQRAQRDQQRLRGAFDGVARPGTALLPTQLLLQVAEAVLLPEASA